MRLWQQKCPLKKEGRVRSLKYRRAGQSWGEEKQLSHQESEFNSESFWQRGPRRRDARGELEKSIIRKLGCWYKGANARDCKNTVLASVSKAIKCLRTKIARQKREREVILVDGKNVSFFPGNKGGLQVSLPTHQEHRPGKALLPSWSRLRKGGLEWKYQQQRRAPGLFPMTPVLCTECPGIHALKGQTQVLLLLPAAKTWGVSWMG